MGSSATDTPRQPSGASISRSAAGKTQNSWMKGGVRPRYDSSSSESAGDTPDLTTPLGVVQGERELGMGNRGQGVHHRLISQLILNLYPLHCHLPPSTPLHPTPRPHSPPSPFMIELLASDPHRPKQAGALADFLVTRLIVTIRHIMPHQHLRIFVGTLGV